MRTPIDHLLGALEWREITMRPGNEEDPYTTHEALLEIEGLAFVRVYQLSDGTRVIDSDDLGNLFLTTSPSFNGGDFFSSHLFDEED